jgi:hypothetical protein
MLIIDWQTEIDISKVGSAFILKFMQQKKREIVLKMEPPHCFETCKGCVQYLRKFNPSSCGDLIDLTQ